MFYISGAGWKEEEEEEETEGATTTTGNSLSYIGHWQTFPETEAEAWR